MMIDEFIFHHRRGLQRWERWGHPLDTLLFALAASSLLWSPDSLRGVFFAILSVLSCLAITKDEWVHAAECSGTEQWLHAVLFILHPLVLLGLWQLHHIQGIFSADVFLSGQFVIASVVVSSTLFMIYQLIYWNRLRFS